MNPSRSTTLANRRKKRNPDFDDKIHNVLLVYKQHSLQFDDGAVTHILSYDEKPRIQAIANTSDDLMSTETSGVIKRDYEYKRLGTVSLLAGIDLQTGNAVPLVSNMHDSGVYIAFLKMLDDKYPKGDKIRLILDNLMVLVPRK